MPAGCAAPTAAAWPRRSWQTKTGPRPASTRRPRPATRVSPTTGTWWRSRPPGRATGAVGTSATCWPAPADPAPAGRPRSPQGSGRRDLAGAARDEPGGDDVRLRRRGVPLDAAEQDLGGERADGQDVLGDHADRGVEHVGQRQVVEAHQGGAALGAAGAQRPDGAEGDQVLAAEQRRGRIGAVEQGGDGGLGGLGGVQVVAVTAAPARKDPPAEHTYHTTEGVLDECARWPETSTMKSRGGYA